MSTSVSSFSAEIIAVGTELLLGEVINSNAAYLSYELAQLGIDVFYHTTVGDNPARIQAVLKTALSRANVIIFTGGLGPTDDDLTVASVANLFEAPMISDSLSLAQMESIFAARGVAMSPSNRKQALRPTDAEALSNPMGTAPGLFWDVTDAVAQRQWGAGEKWILAFPGVPREMKSIWQNIAKPKLESLLPTRLRLITHQLRFFGISESLLGEKLSDLMAQASPSVSPYVSQGEVRIRLAIKATSEAEATTAMQPIETEIRNRVGEFCFGTNADTMESAVAQLLIDKNWTVAVAESCTGGLVSSRLTDVSGSSAYTLLNMVTYSNEMKTQMLGVPKPFIDQHGAVSAEVAEAMAIGICKPANVNIGLSLTGIAGPTGGSDEKPVGLVYIGIADKVGNCLTRKINVNANYPRHDIKLWFSQYALNFLRLYLLGLLDADQ